MLDLKEVVMTFINIGSAKDNEVIKVMVEVFVSIVIT